MEKRSELELLRQRNRELEEMVHYFRTLYETTVDAVLLIDPEIGIFDCNGATIAMFRGCDKGAICGLSPADLSAPHQAGGLPSKPLAMQHIAEAFEKGQIAFDWQARRLDGEQFPVHITLVAITVQQQPVLQCIMRDATELKQRQLEAQRIRKELEQANRELQHSIEQLQLVASTDQLTSAWNRRYFNRIINTERARAARSGQPLSLILVDIDHFKEINDNYGHLVGDEVLVEVANTLQQSLRATDYLVRWGGEEFAILVPELDEAAGVMLAERLREEIALMAFSNGIRLTISAGVAQLTEHDVLTKWVSRVDNALYAAKNGGRNCVAVARGVL